MQIFTRSKCYSKTTLAILFIPAIFSMFLEIEMTPSEGMEGHTIEMIGEIFVIGEITEIRGSTGIGMVIQFHLTLLFFSERDHPDRTSADSAFSPTNAQSPRTILSPTDATRSSTNEPTITAIPSERVD